MGYSHDAVEDEDGRPFCIVGLAGAMMARIGNYRWRELTPHYFEDEVRDKLIAINCFSRGWLSLGLLEFGIDDDTANQFADVKIANYQRNRARFKADMRRIMKQLRAKGL